MSTSTARVGYLAKRAIDWRIWDPTGGALINDVSLNDAENEVLFVPGQKLQIEKINFVWRHYPQAGNEKIKGPAREGVSAPSDRFPQNDHRPQAWNDHAEKVWEVDLKWVTAPKRSEAESASEDIDPADTEKLDPDPAAKKNGT